MQLTMASITLLLVILGCIRQQAEQTMGEQAKKQCSPIALGYPGTTGSHGRAENRV